MDKNIHADGEGDGGSDQTQQAEQGLKRRALVVSGIFYPDDPEILAAELASWGLKKGSEGQISGGQVILAPHGAWDLTGALAASAFASVQGKGGDTGKPISRVLLLGASHHSNEENICLSDSVSFETPLGDLSVSQKLNRELASCSTLIRVNDIPHLTEHSLEVLLPMVKYCFPSAKIIPILMAGARPMLISILAKALYIVFEKYMQETLILISSNISHSKDPALAKSMADDFNDILEKMESKALVDGIARGRISACGGALVATLLESGLLDGKNFSSLCPYVKGIGESDETVYYGAYGV